MTIQDRISSAENQYNTKQHERERHLALAEECLVEMNRLQGEYRVLDSMLKDKPTDEATTITAKAAKEQ